MEQEPNKPKRYYLEFEGKRYILGPDNTVLYLHANNPAADHYYVQFDDGEMDDEGDAIQRGHYGWREVSQNFDEMILNLIQIGCQQILKPDPSHFDLEQYQSRFGHLPTSQPAEKPLDKELDYQPLTARQERLVNFAAYLLLHNHLTPQEFNNVSGELYL
jgi:hypothetical protein